MAFIQQKTSWQKACDIWVGAIYLFVYIDLVLLAFYLGERI